MTSFAGATEFEGVLYYRDQNDATFSYLPAQPTPETDAQGRPTLMVWASDTGAILQLGTRWGVDDATLTRLRQHLAKEVDVQPESIRLSPLPCAVEAATVAIGNGARAFTDLQRVSAAGYPPFSAIFNVKLSAQQKSDAIAALNGREGFLTITYRGTASIPVTAETRIEGDVREDLALIGDDPSLADCADRIAGALAAGRLRVQHLGSPVVPDHLRERADQLAQQKAAALLLRMARDARNARQKTLTIAESTLKSTAALTETVSQYFERSTDVSTWFRSGQGVEHVHLVGVSLEPSPQPSRSAAVRIGFDARQARIAFIQVTSGSSSQVLRGPGFSPVTLNTTGQPLVVKTSYSLGGPAYETTLASAGEEGWSLSPRDLGLVQITVDVTGRRKAGATSAQIRLRYRPSEAGTEDEQVMNFRYGDWTDTWYVITRAPDIRGSLEVEWKETTADGTTVKHAPVTTDNPALIF